MRKREIGTLVTIPTPHQIVGRVPLDSEEVADVRIGIGAALVEPRIIDFLAYIPASIGHDNVEVRNRTYLCAN